MVLEKLVVNGTNLVVVSGEEIAITDGQSALDTVMSIKYETGAEKIIFDKKIISEDFFVLSTGVAGEILQKFINYHIKAAVYGDFSHYTSKALRDFIYESNHGHDFFFVATKEEAIKCLSEA